MKAKITLLPGDGIGPEIVDATRQVLEAVARKSGHGFAFSTHLIGGIAIDETGVPLPDDTIVACRSADAVLLGAVGGPKWDDPTASVRPEQGLLGMRKALKLFANVRPVKLFRGLEAASPLKAERLKGVDLVFIRELTGGIYFGQPKGKETRDGRRIGFDTMVYDENEIRRIIELAFDVARKRGKRVTSIDKANVLQTMQVWREVATEVGKANPDVQLEHQLVDSAAMRLVTDPSSFDVIVSGNMFGDILSDEGAVLTGSLGLLPSASLGEGTLGVYEPIHGSAPDIAGRGIANPLGTILSAAMLLRHSLNLEEDAKTIEDSVQKVLDNGLRTADLGGGTSSLSTTQMAHAVMAAIEGA
ncbi:MAG: 3-isopropylmalate dehydrogenase [Myxococcales bacterium]|nr:MAG: 3-isopropylmalate dehydrogenase [Myxococcales bacterium]